MRIFQRATILAHNLKIFGSSLYRKPLMLGRVLQNYAKVRLFGQRPFRFLDIALSYDCNFSCTHCSALPMRKPGKRKLTVKDYRRFAKQAMDFGATAFHFTGGEPLLRKDLFEIIHAFQPHKNLISIQSNAYLATESQLDKLRSAGVDIFCVSLDSSDPKEHDEFRRKPGSYDKVIEVVKAAKKKGFTVAISVCVSHSNLHTNGFKKLLDLIKDLGVHGFLNLAVPIGHWAGNFSEMITPDDRKEINRIIEERPYMRTDFESTWKERGCSALKEKAYLTPYGDIMPCPFIQISYGNFFEKSFADIIRQGMEYNIYQEYQPYCLAAECKEFVNKHACYQLDTVDLPLPHHSSIQKSHSP